MQILTTSLDLLNQKFWDWAPAICVLRSPPDGSDARQNLRIIVLYYAFLTYKILGQVHYFLWNVGTEIFIRIETHTHAHMHMVK